MQRTLLLGENRVKKRGGKVVSQDDSIETSHIQNGAITAAKLSPSLPNIKKFLQCSSLGVLSWTNTPSFTGGYVAIQGTTSPGELRLNCEQNVHKVTIKGPPNSAAQDYTLTLPQTSPSADKFLQTDANGQLSWQTASGGGYSLQIAASDTLGGVKINGNNLNNLSINSTTGVLSAIHPNLSGKQDALSGTSRLNAEYIGGGNVTNAEFDCLDGINTATTIQAQINTKQIQGNYLTSVTQATHDTLGGVIINGNNLSIDNTGLLSASDATKAPLATPTFTGGHITVQGDGSSNSGYIELKCEQNTHGVKIKGPPHSTNNVDYTLTLPGTVGTNGQILQTDATGGLSWVAQSGGGGGAAGGISTIILSAAVSIAYSGAASSSVTFRINEAVLGGVLTLTPSGTGLTFTPAQVNITDTNTESAAFTIEAAANNGSTTNAISVALTGTVGNDITTSITVNQDVNALTLSTISTKYHHVDSSASTGEQNVSNGQVNLTSSDLELATENSNQIVAVRIPVDLDSSAILTEAKLIFALDETAYSGLVKLNITAQLINNAPALSTSNGNFSTSNRSRTSNTVLWTIASNTDNTPEGLIIYSADIQVLINEILALSGWQANNYMCFFISLSSGTSRRVAESYNINSSNNNTAGYNNLAAITGSSGVSPALKTTTSTTFAFPSLTGNTCTIAGITYNVTASVAYTGGSLYEKYMAFDKNNNTMWHTPWTPSTSYNSSGNYYGSNNINGVYGEWVKLQMSVAQVFTGVKIIGRSGVSWQWADEWTILASNNNTSWTTLHSSTTTTDYNSGSGITETWTNTIAYAYYAIVVEKAATSNCALAEIEYLVG